MDKPITNHQLVNQASGDVELYTPPAIIEAARQTMGGIDLDPASCDVANQRVRALGFYTEEDDGLSYEWEGRIWLNHPFGKPERMCGPVCKKNVCKRRGYHLFKDKPGNADWINKLVHEYKIGNTAAACCITFAATSEAWFRPLLNRPQCYLCPRTNYITPDGKVKKGITKGSVVTYFGPDVTAFYHAFRTLGVVHVPFSENPYAEPA